MKMKVFCVVILAACAAAVPGCGSSRAGGVLAPENARTILVAVDRSRSMYLNDPVGLMSESLQAMIALAPPGSNFGVVAYGEQAEELAPPAPLQTRKDRERIAQAASSLTLKGKTDFDVPFKTGSEMFSEARAPEGSSLILVTDGQHNRGDTGAILDRATAFTENKWEINALAVTPSRHISFLKRITDVAGGETFRISDAQESLAATLQLAADADRMFAFLGDYSALTVLPGTVNILLVALKDTPLAGFVSLDPAGEADGNTQISRESLSVYAYPAELGMQVPFDIVNIWAPPEGLYEVIAQGDAIQSHLLCNLPVRLSFMEGSLKELYDKAEIVKVSVEVDTDNPDLYEIIRASGAVEISAEPGGPGNKLKKVLEFTEVTENGSSSLVFTGDLPLFAGGLQPVEFRLTVTLAINCAADGVWLGKKHATVKVTPGGSLLTADPMEIDFGPHWSDEEALIQDFEVSSIFPGLVAVTITEIPPHCQVEPTEFDVSDELRQKVTVALDPAKVTEFGSREFELLLANTIRSTENEGKELPVPVKVSMYKIEMPEEFAIPAHPGKEFTRVVPVTVTPPLNFECEIAPLAAETGGELEAKVVRNEKGEIALAFSVPLSTIDGVYEGELKMTPEIEGLSARVIKVSLSVSGTPQIFSEPEKLTLKADKSGWIEETVTLWAEHFEDLTFGVNLKDIESETADMLISGEYDAEFVPLDGWDGNKIKPGEKRKAKLRFYISTDLQSGSYAGEVELWVVYRTDNKITAKLPVRIELTR